MREAVRQVRRHAPFQIDAWVVLPDHMHCLWTLPAGDADFPGRRRAIKTAFSKALPARESRSRAWELGIWQRRCCEHTIRDGRDFAAHLDDTHFDPVKHGLVKHPADWPHSSFRQCVAKGPILPDGSAATKSRSKRASGTDRSGGMRWLPPSPELKAFPRHVC
jgi:putative transposase